MKKVLNNLQRVENILIIVSFTAMVVADFAQVVNRNVFKLGIGWFEELAAYCMVWMALLGAEMGLRDGSQASVVAVVERLKGKVKSLVILFGKLVVVVFTGMVSWSAVGMVLKQIETGQTSPALKVPMAIPYAALLVSFAIMFLVQGVTFLSMCGRFAKGKSVAMAGQEPADETEEGGEGS